MVGSAGLEPANTRFQTGTIVLSRMLPINRVGAVTPRHVGGPLRGITGASRWDRATVLPVFSGALVPSQLSEHFPDGLN